jgi:hypothetical protein
MLAAITLCEDEEPWMPGLRKEAEKHDICVCQLVLYGSVSIVGQKIKEKSDRG